MKQFTAPPRVDWLESTARKDATGALRKWTSSATSCVAFRAEIRSWTISNQGGRCAYCLLPVGEAARRTETLDHFVPKNGAYPQWTYESLNLFLSCDKCNSGIKQSHEPLVAPVESSYAACTFSMFHPYLDAPVAAHIEGGYDGATEPELIKGVSDKGKETIRVFRLDNPDLFSTWLDDYDAAVRRAVATTLPDQARSTLEEMRSEAGLN